MRQLLCALLAASSLNAQQASAPSGTTTTAALAKYDVNQNGILDPGELAAKSADEATVASTAAAAVSTSPGSSDNVVELSPFTVEAGQDRGYFGANTMSGTRLNSNVEDLAASITVITKQQMLDTAALDINDIFNYEANTEGMNDFNNYALDRNGNPLDQSQSNPETSNRIRGIGAANIARSGFTSNSAIPFDTYNVDAVEISRGPNSNIFGVGDAAGSVNVIASKANVSRESTSLSLRADNFGGFRSNIDLNRPLIQGKLAVRLLGLYEEKGYTRKPSVDRTNRLQFGISARPFKNTTINASFESYHNFARRPNTISPRDGISEWLASGSPTYNPMTGLFTFSDGRTITRAASTTANNPTVQVNGGGVRPSIFVDENGIGLWMVNRPAAAGQATPANTGGNADLQFYQSRPVYGNLSLFNPPSITNKALYDWEHVNFASANWRKAKSDMTEIEVEQIFLNTERHVLALQAGYRREDSDDFSRNFIASTDGASSQTYVDINERLLDGRPNPYFKRPFIAGVDLQLFERPVVSDNYRATLAYKLDLTKNQGWTKWLGSHRFTGYGEYRDVVRSDTGLRYRDVVMSDHAWLAGATGNRANGAAHTRGYARYYVGDANGSGIDHGSGMMHDLGGTYPFTWFNGVTNSWMTENATLGQTFYTGNLNNRVIKTKGGIIQSFLAGNRIIPTFGIRSDSNSARRSEGGTLVDGINQQYPGFDTWRDWLTRSGKTTTKGVVVRPMPWVQVSYNESDSFNPADLQYNVFGELLDEPSGEGKDYGLRLNLFRNKLSISINKYETLQLKSRQGDSVAARANRLDFGTDAFNLEDQATEWVNVLHPTWTEEQKRAEVYQYMGLPGSFVENMSGKSIAEQSDVKSQGYEYEINYNPTNTFTIKFTAAEKETIDLNLSPNVAKYIEYRDAHWRSVINPLTGLNWFTTGPNADGTGNSPESFLIGSVINPLRVANANEGKSRPQVQKWTFRVLSSFSFSGVSDNRWLKNLRIGGNAAWGDPRILGYYGITDPDGVIRSLDKDRVIMDKRRITVGLNASYTTRLFRDKIGTTFQINVNNLTDKKELRPTSYNPDGVARVYRIMDGPQVIFTSTFRL